MNLARIKLMALLLHALCVVQTVSLYKLAGAIPTDVDRDSNFRRIQRFFAKYVLDLDIIARMIFSLLPVKTELVLSMDRSNWKFGIIKPSTGERIRASWIFNDLRVGEEKFYYKLFLHKGEYVYLVGSRIKNSDGIP